MQGGIAGFVRCEVCAGMAQSHDVRDPAEQRAP
jgi:hypothetical protein